MGKNNRILSQEFKENLELTCVEVLYKSSQRIPPPYEGGG